jgi:hypothetical protein
VRTSEYLVAPFYLKQNKMEEKQIMLDVTTVKFIIEKLEALKEIDELNLTDWDRDESTEDRLSFAEGYIECGNLIKFLNAKLYGE